METKHLQKTDVIHLQEIDIKLSSAPPHRDIPAGSQIFAQIIIEHTIFAQTVPVDSVDEKEDHWKLIFDCNIPQRVECFSVAVLRETGVNVTRLLGTVNVLQGDVLKKQQYGQNFELSLTFIKVNDDGPLLIPTTSFWLSSSEQTRKLRDSFELINIETNPEAPNICGLEEFSLNSQSDLISSRLLQMDGFSKLGEDVDPLEISTTYTRLLLSDADPSVKAELLNLAGNVCSRYLKPREAEDLDRAVGMYEDAVRVADNHFIWPHHKDLGRSLWRKFMQLGEIDDINQSVQVFEDGLSLCPDSEKINWLVNLGVALLTRFERLGIVTDLDRSIQTQDDALLAAPDSHPNKAGYLNNFGRTLLTRFNRLGELDDLNRAIQVQHNAVLLIQDGHPNKPGYLTTLSNLLSMRFKLLDDLEDLDRCIKAQQNIVMLIPDGHLDKFKHLSNLGNSLLTRFSKLGDSEDLDRSIESQDIAVLLVPDGHPGKPDCLVNSGNALLTRFESLGDSADLYKSIELYNDAILLLPDGHPNKARYLNNLGNSLWTQFKQRGHVDDLNRAIQVYNNAISLTPDSHPDKTQDLSNFATSLASCFEQLGNFADLNRAIQVQEDAIMLTTDGHPNKPGYLNNLGNMLLTRFERSEDLADLSQSVQTHDYAVLHTPSGHPSRPRHLHNLGYSLLKRFERLNDLTDLKRSIEVYNDAILLIPDGDPGKPQCLSNLGGSLLTSFKKQGNLADLNKSIQFQRDAIFLTPDDHPDKPSYLVIMGDSLLTRFQNLDNIQDLDGAVSSYTSAAKSVSGPAIDRFNGAKNWAYTASVYFPEQAIEAFSSAIDLVPQLAWLGSSLQDRHHQVRDAGTVARDAAAIAIASGKYNIALEWLEQGRSVTWTQQFQLRSPVDKLYEVHPELADELQSLCFQLEDSTSHTLGRFASQNIVPVDYHLVAQKHARLLTEIRQLKDYGRFLLSKTVNELLPAASHGPVVMINNSHSRCDALILCPGQSDVLHVPLGDIFLDVEAWSAALQLILTKGASLTNIPTRLKGILKSDGGLEWDHEHLLAYVLNKLWNHIAHPILAALGITKPMEGKSDVSRIWWCPTGPLTFLPIHAAGVYPELNGQSGPRLSDYVISSYTPSFTALLNKHYQKTHNNLQLLTVALPEESQLPGTAKEVKCIVNHAAKVFHVINLLEMNATSENVAKAMQKSSWVHFACHGVQHPSRPTKSCLLLSGHSELTLSDIIGLQLTDAELVYLSACQTATGNEQLQDEAVHLAAGMLLAGFQGVIATRWTIDDGFAVEVADETYHLLVEEYKADSTRAAEALHFATQKVQENRRAHSRKVSFLDWVPFIHMGL